MFMNIYRGSTQGATIAVPTALCLVRNILNEKIAEIIQKHELEMITNTSFQGTAAMDNDDIYNTKLARILMLLYCHYPRPCRFDHCPDVHLHYIAQLRQY